MEGGEVTQHLRLLWTLQQKIAAVIQENKMLNGRVKRGLERISLEMKLAAIEIKSSNDMTRAEPAHEAKIVLLKELAMDVEDFIDLNRVPTETSGFFRTAVGLDPRPEIVESLNKFKEDIQKVREWKPVNGVGLGSSQQLGVGERGAAPRPAPAHPPDFDESSRDELLRWLRPEAQGQPQELKVISIVGCRGMGKTALARAVYQACTLRQLHEYDFISWVAASECKNRDDLLTKVLEHNSGSTSRIEQPSSLREFLRDRRYLVIIDDMSRAEMWQIDEFPENGNSSRIIVTTSIHSVARRDKGFVYPMQCLGKTESEDLLWEIVGRDNLSPVLNNAPDDIILKCGGLPLAVVSAASYLRNQGQVEHPVTGGVTIELCRRVSRELGDKILQGREAEFERINRALQHCYSQLPDYTHRNILLYASVFPKGRPIRSKVLIRRLIAEGLVAGHSTHTDEQVATSCLYQFTDRSIVEPLVINNAEVSTFKVYSIILEFIICKAISENFVALVQKGDNGETVYNRVSEGPIIDFKVRRLSVHDGSEEAVNKVAEDINLCYMRSLTVCKSDFLHTLGIQVCKLLRVLDLRGCKGVNDIFTQVICKLHCLKYLSLRETDVVSLPPDIGHLTKLQTLDIRNTPVNTLPIEVIKLPLLAHLFGQFELPSHVEWSERSSSKLQTLAGVCIRQGEDKSFDNIILHATNLRKVKIYQQTSTSDLSGSKTARLSSAGSCRASASISNSPLLQPRSKPLSVSIDSTDLSREFVSYLKAPSAITSIKLRGNLEKLPAAATLKQLIGLHELTLISAGLSVEALSALQDLHYLQYLKLKEDLSGCRWWKNGTFVVHKDGFPSLKRLCFEAPKLPEIIFRQGSMQTLTILELLSTSFSSQTCDDRYQSWFGVQGILHLGNLHEVILHHSTEKMQDWKKVALRHKNKPSVKRQPQPQ
ncbi:disease resistance protein RGA4-like [Oryza glaberrima]|uniref:disease resistance protein RGA4-like n=1 Tax=Oryza glaberrima TaxID=4538 RepID=UPI00224C317A|nr:disease resistance protein RGA4-like [Oryza glaberrima]